MAQQKTVESRTAASWQTWEDFAWELLVKEMKLRKVTYKALSQRLEAFGIYESAARLNRKVHRGKFSGAFLLACLRALEVDKLELGDGPNP